MLNEKIHQCSETIFVNFPVELIKLLGFNV